MSGESGWNPVIWPVKTIIAISFSVFAIQLIAEVIKTGNRILSLIFLEKRSKMTDIVMWMFPVLLTLIFLGLPIAFALMSTAFMFGIFRLM